MAAPVIIPELDTHPVTEEKLVIVTSRAYPAPKDFLANDVVKIVIFDQGCSYRARLEVWLKANGILKYQFTIINTLEGMINFVEASIGITLLPQEKGELGKLATIIVSRNNMPKFGAMHAFMQMF